MGVDFVWMDKDLGGNTVTLEHQDFEPISDAISVLERKTGTLVDEYKDTRLSPDHAGILRDNIKPKNASSEAVQQFVEMLSSAVERQRWILVIGD